MSSLSMSVPIGTLTCHPSARCEERTVGAGEGIPFPFQRKLETKRKDNGLTFLCLSLHWNCFSFLILNKACKSFIAHSPRRLWHPSKSKVLFSICYQHFTGRRVVMLNTWAQLGTAWTLCFPWASYFSNLGLSFFIIIGTECVYLLQLWEE